VELEYWRVEAFEVEAKDASEAEDLARDMPFEDLTAGEFKCLSVREMKPEEKLDG
jgi:hypothetical protein